MSTMQTNVTIDNRVFLNALAGSLLFIFAVAFSLANFAAIAAFSLYPIAGALALAMSSFSFYYNAVRIEKTGPRQLA